jgi:3-methyladenine DNA glycosylase/8-oxoguanine DNA glycosylase
MTPPSDDFAQGRLREPQRQVAAVPLALSRATLLQGVAALAARDAVLAGIAKRHGPPPLWGRRPGFSTLVRIVLEQQVSLASAAALFATLKRTVGGDVTPEHVASLGAAGLQAIGLTRQKARYIAGLADEIMAGRLSLQKISRMPDASALATLMSVPGIGPWTAGIYQLMALRRPDIWPPGDLGLHKSIAETHGLEQIPSSIEASEFALRWRPWRAVAARLLWHSYLARRNGSTRWNV